MRSRRGRPRLRTADVAGLRSAVAAKIEGGADPDLGYEWRGVFREGEPGLDEILKHFRVVILGEPGAGKSLVARAAVQEVLRDR